MQVLNEKELSGNSGHFIPRFEREFAGYTSCKYGISVSSGTTALHTALAALKLGAGDKILIPAFTNMATFFAALYLGATPVPIDIEPDTWNLDPSQLEDKVDRETRAVLPVHIYGHPVDMDPLLKLASRHGLHVVEDCAEAHGALYNGKKVGSLGDLGVFSFYGNKIITTGEGGMLVTNSESLADRARELKSLAYGKRIKFMHRAIGYNYRMTNLQAAIGCAQMKRIDLIISKKRRLARFYSEALSDVPGLQLPVQKDYARNVYWMYHILVEPKKFGCSRARLMQGLLQRGVESREAFVPFNQQEMFLREGLTKRGDCPVATGVGERGFYIPSGPLLSTEELGYVVKAIKSIQRESRR
jgi:perosamine synthetase